MRGKFKLLLLLVVFVNLFDAIYLAPPDNGEANFKSSYKHACLIPVYRSKATFLLKAENPCGSSQPRRAARSRSVVAVSSVLRSSRWSNGWSRPAKKPRHSTNAKHGIFFFCTRFGEWLTGASPAGGGTIAAEQSQAQTNRASTFYLRTSFFVPPCPSRSQCNCGNE